MASNMRITITIATLQHNMGKVKEGYLCTGYAFIACTC